MTMITTTVSEDGDYNHDDDDDNDSDDGDGRRSAASGTTKHRRRSMQQAVHNTVHNTQYTDHAHDTHRDNTQGGAQRRQKHALRMELARMRRGDSDTGCGGPMATDTSPNESRRGVERTSAVPTTHTICTHSSMKDNS
jgi:hypothetical protein